MQALSRIAAIQSQAAALTQMMRPSGFSSQLSAAVSTDQPRLGGEFGAAATTAGTRLPSVEVDQQGALLRTQLRAFPTTLTPPTNLTIPEGVDLPDRAGQWLGEIEAAADRHGVPPELLTALVWSESAFSADAVSHAGAIGLAQLMPGTAAMMNVDPHDPRQNLEGGARYLAAQLDRFGSVDLALAAYNAGPARVARTGGIPNITETQNYVQIVTQRYDALRYGAAE